jgi:uncharacterized membrane protein YgcG
LSRFRILALFATIAALAAVFAACGSSGGSEEDPQKVIENASLSGVKSGNLDVSFHVKGTGNDAEVSISGPFQSGGGKEELPELDLGVKVHGTGEGEAIDFEGGLTLLSDRAYVAYKGTNYEVDPTTFGLLKSSIEQAQQQGSKENAGDVTACQKAAEGLKLSEFVDNLSNEGSAEVDGTSTTKVSGDVNVGSAVDAVIKLAENPACATQLQAAGPLPLGELEKAKGEITEAVKKAHAEVYVGEDNIVRKIAGEVAIDSTKSGGPATVEFELSLGEVNEEQQISAPSGSTKPLEQLFQKLGINPLELLEAGSSGQGLGGLLEGLGGGSGSGGGSSSSSGGGSSSGGSAAYLECLQNAKTPVDIQNCASAQ